MRGADLWVYHYVEAPQKILFIAKTPRGRRFLGLVCSSRTAEVRPPRDSLIVTKTVAAKILQIARLLLLRDDFRGFLER